MYCFWDGWVKQRNAALQSNTFLLRFRFLSFSVCCINKSGLQLYIFLSKTNSHQHVPPNLTFTASYASVVHLLCSFQCKSKNSFAACLDCHAAIGHLVTQAKQPHWFGWMGVRTGLHLYPLPPYITCQTLDIKKCQEERDGVFHSILDLIIEPFTKISKKLKFYFQQ